MSFKRVSIVALFISIFVFGSIAGFGQTGTVSGMVYKLDANGEKIPIEGAKVTCYRTDINLGCRNTSTNKRGEFLIAGIPLVAKVILAVSGPELSPTVYPETPVSSEAATKIEVQMDPGDGSEATEEDVRELAARQFKGGELTAEQKAEAERIEKERLEIMKKNEKIEERNALKTQLLKDGEAAFKNDDFKTAAEKFKEGYELDPDFVGSAPVFLNNRASALKKGAVEEYNAAVNSKDSAKISAARVKLAADFTESLTASLKAYDMASNAVSAQEGNIENNKKNVQLSEAIVKDAFRILGKLSMNLAGNVGSAEEANDSVALYKSSLGILPDNPDVLSGLMFALYMSSSFSGDAALLQESLDYGAHYLKTVKDDHSQKQAVTEIVELIKTENKLKPNPIKL